MGGYFGGRLAQAGEDVTFIARGEHLQALRSRGLRVDSINGDFAVSPVTATDDPAQIGAVVRFGRDACVSVPINEFIYHSLLPLELKARGELQFPD